MKCFHHNDADGKCAAFWVEVNEGVNDKVEMFELGYIKDFPLEIINKDEKVYIVDYSIRPDEMEKLLKMTKNVVWIDHHKTAIEKYKDFKHKVDGLRVDGIAGCSLTYLYFRNKVNKCIENDYTLEKFREVEEQLVPEFTKLIADRDVWRFHYGETTKKFNAGLLSHDQTPTFENWYFIENNIGIICKEGEIIHKFLNITAENSIKLYSFKTKFEGYKCIAMNTQNRSSEQFESASDYDIMMPFVWVEGKWRVSLYTTKDIDVSEIAKKYNGGGHKKASGFVCNELPFEIEVKK